MPSEMRIGESVMRSEPKRNATNKFVITESGAWFVPVEEGVPSLAEMLREIFGESLDAGEFAAKLDEKLEDGRVILGYVRKSGEVEIHSPLFVPHPKALRRLKEVFGDVRVEGMGWTASTGAARR